MSGYNLTLAGAAEGTEAVDAMGWSDWEADALFADGFAGLSAPRRWRRWAVTAALPHPKWAGRWVQGSAMSFACAGSTTAGGGGADGFLSAAKVARKASSRALAASSGESEDVGIRKGFLELVSEQTAVSHRS